MRNINIIADKNLKSTKMKNKIQKKIKNIKINKKNVTIVIGGDGFMLKTLKNNKNKSKLFYGINSGNYGFLMNKFSEKNIAKNLKRSYDYVNDLNVNLDNNTITVELVNYNKDVDISSCIEELDS